MMAKLYIGLIVGLILFSIGAVMNTKYEDEGIAVSAVITRIETEDDTDDGPISYKHTFYGTYTVDGNTYTDVRLGSYYNSSTTPPQSVGDAYDLIVNPDNPSKQLPEGGLFLSAGMILSVVYGVKIYQERKKAKQPTT